MSKLAKRKPGSPVLVKHRPVVFARWPMTRTTRRFGLQSVIFASSPWEIIRDSIRTECLASSRAEALAYADQAQEYFGAAEKASTVATKPVLFYYSFLNLAKALILTTGVCPTIPSAMHGISEEVAVGGKELLDASVICYRSKSGTLNIYDKFLEALFDRGLPRKSVTYKAADLASQILQGHRIWCRISGETERFISIKKIALMHDASAKTMWLCIDLYADDLTRLGVTRKRFLDESGLASKFREIKHNKIRNGRRIIRFEQKSPITYSHIPSDKVQDLVDVVIDSLWTNVLSVPPYRKYYAYMSPTASKGTVPQLCSIYLLFYYLGSVTRYRPHKFNEMMDGEYSAQLRELLSNIPTQFVYLLASEFACQDVVRAAVI